MRKEPLIGILLGVVILVTLLSSQPRSITLAYEKQYNLNMTPSRCWSIDDINSDGYSELLICYDYTKQPYKYAILDVTKNIILHHFAADEFIAYLGKGRLCILNDSNKYIYDVDTGELRAIPNDMAPLGDIDGDGIHDFYVINNTKLTLISGGDLSVIGDYDIPLGDSKKCQKIVLSQNNRIYSLIVGASQMELYDVTSGATFLLFRYDRESEFNVFRVRIYENDLDGDNKLERVVLVGLGDIRSITIFFQRVAYTIRNMLELNIVLFYDNTTEPESWFISYIDWLIPVIVYPYNAIEFIGIGAQLDIIRLIKTLVVQLIRYDWQRDKLHVVTILTVKNFTMYEYLGIVRLRKQRKAYLALNLGGTFYLVDLEKRGGLLETGISGQWFMSLHDLRPLDGSAELLVGNKIIRLKGVDVYHTSVFYKDVYDIDMDFLNDREELIIGTNPEKYDTDGDSLADGLETMIALSPTDPNDAKKDIDHDGIPTIDEVIRGTNPVLSDTDRDMFPDNIDPNPTSVGLFEMCWVWIITVIVVIWAIRREKL